MYRRRQEIGGPKLDNLDVKWKRGPILRVHTVAGTITTMMKPQSSSFAVAIPNPGRRRSWILYAGHTSPSAWSYSFTGLAGKIVKTWHEFALSSETKT